MKAFQVILAVAALTAVWVGGVRPEAAVALALAAVVVAILDGRGERGVPPILWPLAAAAAWFTVLALPLPVSFAALLSPHYHELRRFVWQALPRAPMFAPLAVDGSATALDAARLWATFSLALVVGRRAHANQPVSSLFTAVAVGGVLQLLVCAWHLVDGAGMHGSFIDPNHQAAFFNIAWSITLGVALLQRGRERALLLASAAVLFAAAIATLSRGGVVAAIVGVCAWAVLFQRRSRGWGLAVLAVLFFVGYVAFDAVAKEFLAPDQWQKTSIWRPALRLVTDFPLGAGRAGFAWWFNTARTTDFPLRYDYIENEYLQTLFDFGPLLGAVAIAAMGWVLWRLLALVRNPPEASHRYKAVAVFVAALMLALHNVFDFNWELAGIFVPMWLLLASLGRANARGFVANAWGAARVQSGHAQWVAAVAALALAVLGFWREPHRLEAAHEFVELVQARPLDSYAMLQLAHGPQAGRWINRALLVDPMWAPPHLALAKILCETGKKSQGRAELALAIQRDGVLWNASIRELRRCIDAPADMLDVGITPALVVELDTPALVVLADRMRESPQANIFAALVPRLRGIDAERWRALMALWPPSPARDAEEAEALWASGDHETALARYAAAANGDPALLPRVIELFIEARRLEEADAAVNALSLHCNGCRAYHLARANIALARGKKSDAILEYRTLLARDPGDTDSATRAADLLVGVGQTRAAVEVLASCERTRPEVHAHRVALEAQLAREQEDVLRRLYLNK